MCAKNARRLESFPIRITKDALCIDEVLQSEFIYEEELVKIIVPGLGGVRASSVGDVAKNLDKTIKIEGCERLNPTLQEACRYVAWMMDHAGPVTCHLFIASEGSASFPKHIDLDDVVVHVVEGTKHMIADSELYTLKAGDSLYMPYGCPHEAKNHRASVMLSFGLERYLIDKVRL